MAELDMGEVAVELSNISENIKRRVSFIWCLEGVSSVSSLSGVTVSWLSLPRVPGTSSIFRIAE